MVVSLRAWIPLLCGLAVTPALVGQGRRATEVEPNNQSSMANVVHLGDTILGKLSGPTSDNVDWFGFDLQAGTRLVIAGLDRNFCRDFHLYDAALNHLAFMDCMEHNPGDTLLYPISVSGRYYLSVLQLDERPSEADHPEVSYTIELGVYKPPRTGPGNPMRLHASGMQHTVGYNSIGGITSSWSGDVYVHDYVTAGFEGTERLMRVSPAGQVSVFAENVDSWGQIAVDAFGDLLTPGLTVSRYSLATGARSEFTGSPDGANIGWTGIAVGPNGDVWISAPGYSGSGPYVARFDAFGTRKETIPVTVGRPWSLGFSPAGDLHYVTQDGNIYKLVNGAAQLVIPSRPPYPGFSDIAFDRDGWLYASEPSRGQIVLFDPQYRMVRDPLAQVLDSLGWAGLRMAFAHAFVRDQNGVMTSRLVATRSGEGFRSDPQGWHPVQPLRGELLESNPAGMGAPGVDFTLPVDVSARRGGSRTLAYSDTLRLRSAGAATWSVVTGKLPAGVTLSAENGVVSGTPTESGTFEFTARAASGARAGLGRFTIVIGDAPPIAFSFEDIAAALMGGTMLSAEAILYLDTHGNKNGKLDVGDLRAYLRSQGHLAPKKP